jgi:hypothetical protein
MIAADRGDASIMDLRTTDAALLKRGAKLRPVALGLCQENETRRLKPGFDLIDGANRTKRLLTSKRIVVKGVATNRPQRMPGERLEARPDRGKLRASSRSNV